uniref:Uncharacterized protein n=1 Tax=Glossina austeni TaxID=7395 RepID=A0A1A9UMK3_GLOAU
MHYRQILARPTHFHSLWEMLPTVANVFRKSAGKYVNELSEICRDQKKKSFAFRRTEQKKAKANATKQEMKTKLQCLTEIVTSNCNDYKQERHSSVTTLQSRHAKRARHVKEFATTECRQAQLFLSLCTVYLTLAKEVSIKLRRLDCQKTEYPDNTFSENEIAFQ